MSEDEKLFDAFSDLPFRFFNTLKHLTMSSVSSPKGSMSLNKRRGGKHRRKGKAYLEEKAFKTVSAKTARFRLIFSSSHRERTFRNHFYFKSKPVVRISVGGFLLILCALIGVDNFFLRDQYDSNVLTWRNVIRGIIQIPSCCGWLGYTFRRERMNENRQIESWYNRQRCLLLQPDYWIIGCSCAFINAICMLTQTVLSKQPEHGLYMLYFFIIYLFVGIPFFFAFLITWGTYLVFLVSMLSLMGTDVIADHHSTATESFQYSAAYLLATNLLLSISAYSLERGERREFVHGLELQNQSGIIEGLLSNLLPEHVTDKFRNASNNDYIIAEQVDECTILFSDMVSFTKWASKQEPDILIQRMHELYACFDDLCRLHRVYKVETIGDAYFVSSNCPIMAPDHANRCMQLGKSMMEECRKLDWAGYSPRMRIGIHTGPVMAGVVGRKMPRYHLFGGTALIAEELESSGKPDYLHISEPTKEQLSSRSAKLWKFECRGSKQFLHGSAEFNTYLVDLTEYLQQE